MRTLGRLLLLAVACLLAATGHVAAMMLPAPFPIAPATPEWNAIGRVNLPQRAWCTGVLVKPDQVLTAAHCLWDRRHGRWLRPGEIHFVAGFRRGDYAGHAQGLRLELPAGIGVDAEGRIARSEEDWALLTLTRSLAGKDVRPLPLAGPAARATLGPDTRLTRIGYERNRPGLPELVDGCRPLLTAGSDQLVLIHDCAATANDAGSPILMQDRGRWVVLGVHVRTARWKGRDVGVAALLERALPASVLKGG